MEEALRLYQETNISVDRICEMRGISKYLFYKNKPEEVEFRGHANKGRIYTFNIDKFKEETDEKYYWLGFLGADGAIVNNTLSIELQSDDIGHLKKFNECFENTAKITSRINNGGHKCSKTTINSVQLKDYLKKYAIVQNKTKSFEMKNIPKKHEMSFIRGFIDGDGTVASRGSQIYFSISSGSEQIIKQIENILETGNKITDYGSYYRLSCLGNKKAMEILKRIYKNSTTDTRLDRKFEVYNLMASHQVIGE